MKNAPFTLTLALLVLLPLYSTSATIETSPYFDRFAKDFIVVIDAGHGGHDVGTSGSKSHEKDIALAVALMTGDMISYIDSDIRVIYTRDDDVFIPLDERVEFANQMNADLFISIHCNAVEDQSFVTGAETYVMGLHSSEENLEVAKRENESILLESNFEQYYEDFDPFSVEGHILLSAIQSSYLERSIHAAERVQQQIAQRTPLVDRGVRQAGFLLLRKATMPSILIESAFLSNKHDEEYLLSNKGQKEISRAIALGIIQFADEIRSKFQLYAASGSSVPATTTKSKKEVESPDVTQNVIAASNKLSPQPEVQEDQVVYKVQVASMKDQASAINGPIFEELTQVEILFENDMFKYLTGNYENLAEAASARSEIQEKGFKGAFIVAYKGDRRVSLQEVN